MPKMRKSFDRFMPPSDRERKQALSQKEKVARVGDEDLLLEQKIKEAIALDPFILVEDIFLHVKNGKVEIEGVVDSPALKERVEKIVWQFPEVKEVRNNLTVGEVRSLSKDQVMDLITKALERVRISLKDVGFDLKGGILTVSGRLPTLWEKMQLMEILNAVPGVKEIQDNLTIGYEENPDDLTLRNKVMLAISELPQLKVSDLKVRVAKGTVYLKGEVKAKKDKLPLIEKVASLTGVKEIVDEIAFEEEEEDKLEDLKRKIAQALRSDPRTHSSKISFDIAGGTIFLQGEVNSTETLYAIEEILDQFPEIKRVVNEITLIS